MKNVNLLFVNGHLLLREGVRSLLKENDEIRVVGEVCDYGAPLNVAADRTIDVVVLDLSLTGMQAMDTIRALKALRPAMKILVFSANGDVAGATNAMADGASGFLTTECDLEEMVYAVHHISEGKRYVCPSIAHEMAIRMLHDDARWLLQRPSQAPASRPN